MSRFTERHLDPASRLGEILFGLIMVLTVTLTASFNVAEGKKGFVSFCSLRLVPMSPGALSMPACTS
jgi:hypothetical protein